MNCADCEELIATAARDGRTLEAAAEHLTGCAGCWEFAKEIALVATALDNWRVPGPPGKTTDAAYAALLDRAAVPSRPNPSRKRRSLSFVPKQPALLVVPGAAAAAAGLVMLPDWARVAAACWTAVSAALVSVVMLSHAQTTASEGDWV